MVGVPAFGVLVAVAAPGTDPGFGMRFAISAVAAATIALSFRSESVRHHLRHVCVLLLLWVYAWFAHRAAQVDMQVGPVVAMMLITAVSVTLFVSALEVGCYLAFVTGVTLYVYREADAPLIVQPMYLAVQTTVVLGMGLVTLARVRLETDLERRVEQRTAELATEVAERRAAEADALRASRAKSRFLANMSHELRTPLNAILGYTELAQEELSDLDRPDLVADLERVRGSASHLLRMIADVLDLSRIEAGQLEVAREQVDVGQVVAELARLVETERARSGCVLEVDVAPGTRVWTDPVRLSQIGLNLLTNALKFTSDGTVRVEATVRDGVLTLTVSDTGVGIPPEHLQRIFDRFVQLDDAPTRRQEGTGLGLALSRELAERLGGTLTARSEVGVGSTFTLELPAGSA